MQATSTDQILLSDYLYFLRFREQCVYRNDLFPSR